VAPVRLTHDPRGAGPATTVPAGRGRATPVGVVVPGERAANQRAGVPDPPWRPDSA